MAFENRGNGRYYYRKVRRGKKVVSEYVGNGEFADLICRIDFLEREKANREAELRKEQREIIEIVDKKLNDFEREVSGIITEYLESLGFHKTTSNEWRLKKK